MPTVLEIAASNEFGLGVPRRSFIADWFDQNLQKNEQFIVRMMKAVASGKLTKERAFELIGLKFQGDIQKRISAGIPPANAPATIKAKGSSTPLIDTGQLRQSITYVVNPKGV